MDRKTAIRKIRACLARAKSSNPTEAATALRQAQAMMREHQVSETDVGADEAHRIRQAAAKTRSRGGEVPRHVWGLAVLVGDAFAAEPVETHSYGSTTVTFFGLGAAAEIASYSFVVLRRQLERDITRRFVRVRNARRRAQRGYVFGMGWVSAVRMMLKPEPLSEFLKQQVAAHWQSNGLSVVTVAPTGNVPPATAANTDDFMAGLRAGKSAQLHRGVNGSNEARALEHAR